MKQILITFLLLTLLLCSCNSLPASQENEKTPQTTAQETPPAFTAPAAENLQTAPEGDYILTTSGGSLDESLLTEDTVLLTVQDSLFAIQNAQGQLLTCRGPYLQGDMEVLDYCLTTAIGFPFTLELIVPYSESFTIITNDTVYSLSVAASDYCGEVQGQEIEAITIGQAGITAIGQDMYVRSVFQPTGEDQPKFWLDGSAPSRASITYANEQYQVVGYTGTAIAGTGSHNPDLGTKYTIQDTAIFTIDGTVPMMINPGAEDS